MEIFKSCLNKCLCIALLIAIIQNTSLTPLDDYVNKYGKNIYQSDIFEF